MKWPSQKMRQTVQVQARGEDLGDGATFGPELPLRCAVDWGNTLTRSSTGEDITVVATILCRPDQKPGHANPATLAPGDRVLIGQDTRTVFAVNPAYTPSGHIAGYQIQVQ